MLKLCSQGTINPVSVLRDMLDKYIEPEPEMELVIVSDQIVIIFNFLRENFLIEA